MKGITLDPRSVADLGGGGTAGSCPPFEKISK